MPKFTFESSGITVQYRQIAPGLLQLIDQTARAEVGDKPTPPTFQEEIAPGDWKEHPNPHDPKYRAAAAEWETAYQTALGALLTEKAVTYALQTPPDPQSVADVREAFGGMGTLPDDDRAIWLWYVCAPSMPDQAAFINAIIGTKAIQEAAARAAASFRG